MMIGLPPVRSSRRPAEEPWAAWADTISRLAANATDRRARARRSPVPDPDTPHVLDAVRSPDQLGSSIGDVVNGPVVPGQRSADPLASGRLGGAIQLRPSGSRRATGETAMQSRVPGVAAVSASIVAVIGKLADALPSSVFGILVALLAVAMVAPRPTVAEYSAPYIVVLREGVRAPAQAREMRVAPSRFYEHALNGYAVRLTESQRQALTRSPDVVSVTPDREVRIDESGAGWPWHDPFAIPSQLVPTGVMRVNGLDSRTARIDGVDRRVDVDVAVIDSGIDAKHLDLNVTGGVNCSSGKSYQDGFGHGTHVAGTIGALDNRFGLVGVAPGARLWAVRVLNDGGRGTTSSFICGVDWVAAHAAIVEVANMSLVIGYADDGNCGYTAIDPLHQAVCALVAAGVTVVAAAGNDAMDAAFTAPASYDEAITVSAYADFDGLPGGLGAPTCGTEVDDSLAYFSNFGSDIDIAAPGVCITSTWPGGLYNIATGTSMAAPHVAGAAALYKAGHPRATPAQVRDALISLVAPGSLPDDPDTFPEGLLNVSGM
jgi:subtilisin